MFKPLSEIDKHLPMPPGGENDLYLSADQAPLEMTGQLPGPRDGYRRLDRARVALLAEQGVNEGAQGLLGNPAGVTVRFRTDSPTIALSVRLGSLVHFPHFALTRTEESLFTSDPVPIAALWAFHTLNRLRRLFILPE